MEGGDDSSSELLLLPQRAAPRPSDLRDGLARAPIPFLLALQPPRPPLSYYGRRCVRLPLCLMPLPSPLPLFAMSVRGIVTGGPSIAYHPPPPQGTRRRHRRRGGGLALPRQQQPQRRQQQP